jgi:hypothetical protein
MVTPKRRGRPPSGGRDPILTLRAPSELTRAVEDWANKQPDQPSRSEALRRLVEMALKMKQRRK